MGVALASYGCQHNSAKLSHCLSNFIQNVLRGCRVAATAQTTTDLIIACLGTSSRFFLSQYFGLCAPTVRPSLVVIRGVVVGRGSGIRNCITQPSKVTNIINSLGDSSSLELRDQPSCLACMTFRYTDGFC